MGRRQRRRLHALTDLSCAFGAFCGAIDSSGQLLYSSNPTGPASSWTTTQITGHALSAVSCVQLTLQCSAADSAGNVYTTTDAIGSLGGGGGGAGTPSLPRQTDKVARNGTLSVKITCRGTESCQGRITLTTTKAHHRTVTIATAHFTIAPGATKMVTLRLNGTGRALVHSHRRAVAVIAQLRYGASTASRTIDLVGAGKALKH